jgi:hypothetical protein
MLGGVRGGDREEPSYSILRFRFGRQCPPHRRRA